MQLIKCTAKLRKEMGLKEAALFAGTEEEGHLGPWHANLIFIDRRKCVLFVNDKTLFNFIVPDVNRAQICELQKLFLNFLRPVLADQGFSNAERENVASEYAEVRFAKSNSKSVLGSMNDLAFNYETRILMAGGIHSPEVPGIISDLNRMPMGALKYTYAIEALRSVLQGGITNKIKLGA